MALAQRQPAPPFQRTLVLPRQQARSSARTRGNNLRVQVSVIVGLISVGWLVAYVCGFSRMTSANYRRCAIQQDLDKLRIQEQLLSAQVTLLKDTERIENWARANGMAPASG